MITELASLISAYGLGTVAIAAALYILLRSEFQFRYPRTARGRNTAQGQCQELGNKAKNASSIPMHCSRPRAIGPLR